MPAMSTSSSPTASYIDETVAGSNGALERSDGPASLIGGGVGVGLRKADDELEGKLNAAIGDEGGRLARRADHQVVPGRERRTVLRRRNERVRAVGHPPARSGGRDDILPQWLKDGIGDDLLFWLGYFTNGKHLTWYASVQYTLAAAVFGALAALLMGLVGASLRNARFGPARLVGGIYINMVRGVPDVLFFLFFPLAFEQLVEWIRAQAVCTPEGLAANAGQWPPCDAANWFLGTTEYLVLACVSLGIVYGAFAANVIAGALNAVPRGQLEAARAFGLSAGRRCSGASTSGRCGSMRCRASPTAGCC